MNVTALKNDLAYLNRFFNWTDEEKREIWTASAGSEEMQDYWHRLARCFRFGYRQTAENGYMRFWKFEEQYVIPYMDGKISPDLIKLLQKQAEIIDRKAANENRRRN